MATWSWRLLTVLVLGVFAWQFYRIARQIDWPVFAAALARPERYRYLLLALLLMPLNWVLEARKWQILLNAFLPWTYARTLRATLAGVALSAATPNRIGEIGGRMMYATAAERGAVVTSSLLGSACQWIAFLLLAWPGLLWTAGHLIAERTGWPAWYLAPVGPSALIVGALLGKPALLRGLAYTGKWFKLDVGELRRGLEGVKSGLIVRAGAYASLRFIVYCTQLYVLLCFFGPALPLAPTLAGIMGIYLVQAGLPLPPGVNLVTRTELGLLLWGDAPDTAAATVMAFTALFALNVLLPDLPGYWLLARKK